MDLGADLARHGEKRTPSRRDRALDQIARAAGDRDEEEGSGKRGAKPDREGPAPRVPRAPWRATASRGFWLLAVVVLAASCTAPPERGRPRLARTEAARADEIDTLLRDGWIRLTVVVPRGHSHRLPTVINPFVPDVALLDRGIAIARYHTNWEALLPFRSPVPTPISPGPELQVGAWLLAAPRPGIVGRAYFSILTTEAEKSVPAVVDFLRTVPQLDPDRISIAGSSTGGFMALQAMAADPRIALGAVRVACGDYHLFLRDSNLGLNGDPRWLVDGEMVLDAEYEAALRRVEPIRSADRFPPRPLLLMTGAEDPAIPAECARATARRFTSVYAEAGVPERFRFVELAAQGHNLAEESDRIVLEWWDHWLLETDVPSDGSS